MQWLRWYHGTVNDPKLRMVAAEAGRPVCEVVAVWAALMECASEAKERGSVAAFSPRVTAFTLGMELGDLLAILTATREAKMLVDDRLAAWDRRQPLREDPTATERKRKQRSGGRADDDGAPQAEPAERDEGEPAATDDGHGDVTHGHAASRAGTTDKIRGEERRETPESSLKQPSDDKAAAGAPGGRVRRAYAFEGEVIRLNQRDYDAWKGAFEHVSLNAELTTRDAWLAKRATPADKRDWFISTSNWLANLNRKAKAEVERIRACGTTAPEKPAWLRPELAHLG